MSKLRSRIRRRQPEKQTDREPGGIRRKESEELTLILAFPGMTVGSASLLAKMPRRSALTNGLSSGAG